MIDRYLYVLPILSHREWRGDCTDGRSDGLRRYDPFGTFPRLLTLSAVCKGPIGPLVFYADITDSNVTAASCHLMVNQF
ncbi:hypothetical protein A6J64_016915 [Yersinia enterocolitica]|nr:hypothetical protein A6J64_016915 [Yersinia enterocolitica]PNM19731.1 hypothetical protein A6J65_013265 [Yersinia enterocolitica]